MPKTIAEAREFLSAATGILCDWPSAFRKDASDRLQRGDQSASTAPERLGRWYQRLMRFSDTAYDDFRIELGNVINLEFDGTYAARYEYATSTIEAGMMDETVFTTVLAAPTMRGTRVVMSPPCLDIKRIIGRI